MTIKAIGTALLVTMCWVSTRSNPSTGEGLSKKISSDTKHLRARHAARKQARAKGASGEAQCAEQFLLVERLVQEEKGLRKDIHISSVCKELERWAQEIRDAVGNIELPRNKVKTLNRYMFKKARIRTRNQRSAVDAAPFLLGEIVKTKHGHCLGLTMLYVILGEKADVPLYGVVVPGHIFVRYDDGTTERNIETLRLGASYSTKWYKGHYQITDQEADNHLYLKNLTAQELFAVFLVNVGQVYAAKGLHQTAIEKYQLAVQYRPNYPEAYHDLGVEYLRVNQPSKAVKALIRAVELRPTYAPSYSGLGAAYTVVGDYDNAAKALSRALELDDALTRAHRNLGILYAKRGLYDQALKSLKHALYYAPRDSHILYYLGVCYEAKGSARKARSYYKRAAKYNPK